MIFQQLLNPHWWQNQIKYVPLVQRVFLARNLSARFPAMLNIEVTNACNLDCSFCPRKLSNRKIGFISEELYRKIIDELAVRGGVGVLWLMKDGEPLMHPEIEGLVEYAKDSSISNRHPFGKLRAGSEDPEHSGDEGSLNSFQISHLRGILRSFLSLRMTKEEQKAARRIEIYTNGILLDRAMGERLIESRLDVLTVSLDAISAETFKKLKGRNEYQKVVENIKKFMALKKEGNAKKPLLTVKMVSGLPATLSAWADCGRVAENEREVGKFKKLWTGVADNVIIQKMHGWEGSVGMEHRAQSTEHRSRVILRSVATKDPLHDRKGILRPSISFGTQNDGGRHPCNLPWLAPAINWNGKVVPCCVNFRENELVMGDVSKDSLAEIYTGPKFQALREAHLKQDFSKFPTCEKCGYWSMLPGMGRWIKLKVQS